MAEFKKVNQELLVVKNASGQIVKVTHDGDPDATTLITKWPDKYKLCKVKAVENE